MGILAIMALLAGSVMAEQEEMKRHWQKKIDEVIVLYHQTKNMPRKTKKRLRIYYNKEYQFYCAMRDFKLFNY